MRRADRLFQIVGLLSHAKIVTARDLAQELEVSERTIYRDIQDLSLSGVPIEGEAGVGYRLMKGFHLPPLMFDEDELAALILGMRMVQTWTDKDLARAAGHVLRKVETVIPERLKPELERQEIIVPDFHAPGSRLEHMALLRDAIKNQRKVEYNYTREDGQHSSRIVRPLGLFYWGRVWTLVAWCELRDAFRHFRLDRMQNIQLKTEKFQTLPGQRLEDYLDGECDETS
ncbi:helix-turn-helix transcriptional regulator [Pseudomonadota bacterium]